MTNYEFYKDAVINAIGSKLNPVCILAESSGINSGGCDICCYSDCQKRIVEWLNEEHETRWDLVEVGTKIRDKRTGCDYDFLAEYRGQIYLINRHKTVYSYDDFSILTEVL